MEIISIVMLSFAVWFITLIITLVFFNFISLMSDEDKSKIAEKSKDLGLAAKVLSDQPKTKVLTREYDVPNKQDSQKLFDAGKMPPIVGLKLNTLPPNKIVTCASYETPPSHKTRVALRNKTRTLFQTIQTIKFSNHNQKKINKVYHHETNYGQHNNRYKS